MEWQDIGLVIGARKYGETSVILEVMTRSRGRCLGVVRGGRSRAQRAILQSGNRIKATWRARLEEQLGAFVIDPIDLRAARFLDSGPTLHGLATLVSLMRLLPERDPHESLFELAEEIIVEFCVRNSAAVKMARFELALLSALGYGLDLQACVLTGDKEDLAYVSPKSGRVVSRSAGAPWRDRLLPYPA
ncbi:MAG: DNA repair protein RecO, partial [Methylocystis sp.]